MEMIFDSDEMITVKEKDKKTWKVRKKDLSKFLEKDKTYFYFEHYDLSDVRIQQISIVLSNLINISSIEIDGGLIKLKPVGIIISGCDEIIHKLRILELKNRK